MIEKKNTNEPGEMDQLEIDCHLTSVQRILQTRDKLLEKKDCLEVVEALEHLDFAIQELSGPVIGPYNIMNAYYNIDQIILLRIDPRQYDVAAFRESIVRIQQLFIVPYYEARIFDQKKQIMHLETLMQRTGSKDEIPDLNISWKEAKKELANLEEQFKAAKIMDALNELQAAGVCKLGSSQETV